VLGVLGDHLMRNSSINRTEKKKDNSTKARDVADGMMCELSSTL
jgi:hypothetical protein